VVAVTPVPVDVIDSHRLDGALLEGPYWDERDHTLLLVDIARGSLLRVRYDGPRGGEVETVDVGPHASVYLPSARHHYLAAAGRQLLLGDPPRKPAGSLTVGDPLLRFNDGACDERGRLWIGTMAIDAAPGAGALYCVEPDLSWRCVLTGVSISNGLGWSPDGATLYYVDSATRRIDAFDFDADEGSICARRVVVDTAEFAGMPDGLAVDTDGGIWVAFYRGASVRRFAPDGRVLAEVAMPVPRPTSLCFVGAELAELVVTVRGEEVGGDGRSRGAHLYACHPGVHGVPTHGFGG
jgi:sugar lactone lactonase YvrE